MINLGAAAASGGAYVIIDNFALLDWAVLSSETDPVLLVDPYAVSIFPFAIQALKTISGVMANSLHSRTRLIWSNLRCAAAEVEISDRVLAIFCFQ
jgi:hypothetical protein